MEDLRSHIRRTVPRDCNMPSIEENDQLSRLPQPIEPFGVAGYQSFVGRLRVPTISPTSLAGKPKTTSYKQTRLHSTQVNTEPKPQSLVCAPAKLHTHPRGYPNQPAPQNTQSQRQNAQTKPSLHHHPYTHSTSQPKQQPTPTPSRQPSLSSSQHNLEPLGHQLANILILVLQQSQRKRDIVPLALGVTPRQPRGQLVRQLLGVLVLLGGRRQQPSHRQKRVWGGGE